MSDSNSKKQKSSLPQEFSRILKDLGLSQESIEKTTNHTVMVHKMALVGILSSMERVAASMKESILGNPGKVPVDALRLYFSALYSSCMFALDTVDDYEALYNHAASPSGTSPSPSPLPSSGDVGISSATTVEEGEEGDGRVDDTDADDLLKDFFPLSTGSSSKKKKN